MRYAIIANPASGGKALQRKRLLLLDAARILDANIHGLDARNPEEFNDCVIRTARECDVLVAAGGDGTLSVVVNAIDRDVTPVGFLPLGAGNAMRDALRLRGNLADIALRIRSAPIRRIDLVDCGGRVAFFASVGIEADVLRVRRRHRRLRRSGFGSYFLAFLVAYFRTYRRVSGTLRVDGAEFPLDRLLTLMVVKHPFHGFGMKVVPRASLDDGKLHILTVNSGFWKLILWGAAALAFQNPGGGYHTGKRVQALFERPCSLQADGEECWGAQTFGFEILKGAIMMKS
jgi:diacylglycerol kinase family enzyme